MFEFISTLIIKLSKTTVSVSWVFKLVCLSCWLCTTRTEYTNVTKKLKIQTYILITSGKTTESFFRPWIVFAKVSIDNMNGHTFYAQQHKCLLSLACFGIQTFQWPQREKLPVHWTLYSESFHQSPPKRHATKITWWSILWNRFNI